MLKRIKNAAGRVCNNENLDVVPVDGLLKSPSMHFADLLQKNNMPVLLIIKIK
jgi:hypothetical protein